MTQEERRVGVVFTQRVFLDPRQALPKVPCQIALRRLIGRRAADKHKVASRVHAGGVGVIVEVASDNRNRATTDVKTAFGKNGGNMAESGSVAFQFTRKGVVTIKAGEDADTTMMTALDCGASDVLEADEELVVYTEMKELHNVRQALIDAGVEVVEADLQYGKNNDNL